MVAVSLPQALIYQLPLQIPKHMDPSDPVPTPVSALDAPLKKYDDMTTEERAEFDRLARKREEEEQAGPR